MISPLGLKKRYSVIMVSSQMSPPVTRISVPRGFGQLVLNLPTGPPVGRPKDQNDNSNPQHLEKDQLHPVPRYGMQTFLKAILLVLTLVSRPSKRPLVLSGLPIWQTEPLRETR